jgi:hypothetical protein
VKRISKIQRVAIGTIGAGFIAVCCCAGIGAVLPDAPDSPRPEPVASSSPSPSPVDAPEPDIEESDEPIDPNVYYPNCAAVRAAGQAPLYLGEPGYRKGLDRDGDGKACDS